MKSFNEISCFDYPKIYFKRIQDEIDSKGKEYILNVDEEEYIKYLVDKYNLEPLRIIPESEEIGEPKKSKVRRQNHWGDEYMADAYTFRITYNFTGSPEIFRIQPSSYAMTSNEINVHESSSTVSFSFTIYKQDEAE